MGWWEPKVLRLQGYGYNPFCSHSSRCLAVLVWQYFEEAFCAPKVRLEWYGFKGFPSHSSPCSGGLFPQYSGVSPMGHLIIFRWCRRTDGWPPKGPFRTKKTTAIEKIVNYYAVVFLLRPPNLLRRGPFSERESVCNFQENGVRTRCAAIVNHRAVLKIPRVVNWLRVVFLVRRGPMGRQRLCRLTDGKRRKERLTDRGNVSVTTTTLPVHHGNVAMPKPCAFPATWRERALACTHPYWAYTRVIYSLCISGKELRIAAASYRIEKPRNPENRRTNKQKIGKKWRKIGKNRPETEPKRSPNGAEIKLEMDRNQALWGGTAGRGLSGLGKVWGL